MSILSSIKNSLLSATNENNASLANLKLDFSLLKVEAPVEFLRLGSSLSTKRRAEAEHGPQHRTARRLAALFEPLIPPTPKLISAYGTRVSEIIEAPGINPVGLQCHGPFKEYIGADGTAAWAAATQGIAALGIYLLSCLLARAWDSKESISLWVELVAERKRQIKTSVESNYPVSEASVVSSLQDISRHDLALWDASARSWLRSADQAKQREHDQLLLMLKNINIPFPGGSSTYDKVMSAWKHAMLGIENLLCGRPQSVSDAGVLLALSSWHLYPDLIVLGNKTVNVQFKDPLLPDTGICTIGLHSTTPEENGGVQWSLTLSHLRYYGSAVSVTSSTDHSRVTISQLLLVAFGGLLGHWRVSPRDFEAAAVLFCSIGDILDRRVPQNKDLHIPRPLEWIQPLIQASRMLNSSVGDDREDNLKLINYGQRRAKTFLRGVDDIVEPYFGLCNTHVLSGLSEDSDTECGIAYLRSIAKAMGYASSDCMIFYPHWTKGISGKSQKLAYFEYLTAIPHGRRPSGKRDSEGRELYEPVHARWYYTPPKSTSSDAAQGIEDSVAARIAQAKAAHDDCFLVRHGMTVVPATYMHEGLQWDNPPRLFNSPSQPRCSSADDLACPLSNSSGTCQCFEPSPEQTQSMPDVEAPCEFVNLCGNLKLGLFVKGTVNNEDRRAAIASGKHIGPKDVIKRFSQRPVSRRRLVDYLRLLEPRFYGELLSLGVYILTEPRVIPTKCYKALKNLQTAARIYSNLEGSTISLQIVSESLSKAEWGQERPDGPTRNEAFACIAHLDSGRINLDPDDLGSTLAMCTQNSIYVAGVILSDPLDPVKEYDIRHLVGNIGKSGICMLVAPHDPQIRPLQDDYHIVNHAPYNFKRESNFNDTSLHLSFTEWSLPLETAETRTIDQELYFVESVISVRDRGVWVADLDILSIQRGDLVMLPSNKHCPGHGDDNLEYDYTSIDNWEEFLDSPTSVGIFRAHGNWVARLAAVSILSQKGLSYCTGIFDRENFCLKCLESQFGFHPGAQLEEFESPLPSICID
ncbi:hypothetical protein FQN49_005848 [Arthroderma sp. PD_2]|nr:hypothetical protein FQN49_005848 [Arthroderma sp. PD_2]